MKMFGALTLWCALIASVAFVAGCQRSEKPASSGSATQYTCAHHPEVVQNTPGKCPKCNMDLKPKT